MAFTINKNLAFIDSTQFMDSSAEVLFKNLSDNNFKHLSQEFNGDLLKLVKRKGVYRYEYADSLENIFEKQLPDWSKFYSSLKNESISRKNYLHANNVWNTFKIKTTGGYHDLHAKTDVLFLADVFEKFVIY